MTQAKTKHDPFQALKISDYRFFLFGKFMVTLSISIQTTVVGWQMYHITGSNLHVGFIGLAEAIPSITIALFSGLVIDSFPRKKIVTSALGLLSICSLLLIILVFPNMSWILQESGVYPIYGVIFLSGIARGFLNPATAAFQTQLVDKETFPNAATWSGIAWQTSLVLGPLMGGMLIVFGLYFAYSVDFLLMSFGLILMLLVKGKSIPEKPESSESIWESLSSGWKFVSTHQIILGAISLDLFAVLFGGAVALLPSFTEKILGQSPEIFGILRSAQGVGAVLCALFIAAKPPKKHSGWILLSCVFGFGICIIFFGLSNDYRISFFCLAAAGAFDMVSVVIRHTIVQMHTPDHMRGRVSAVNYIFIGSSNEIGEFESGVTAEWLGIRRSIVAGGILTLLTVGFVGTIAPRLRKMQLKDIL
ncbi:MFS transporter [Leptospira borgpetersenii]|uniref:Permease of the major facilitator superfamily n=2 Tax=Leptospira borgpetersenii serovar Hardjo-bovis TaxID=338217 RepID=Q04QN8_LEPBJ|nr:MFS transporter [Leptospira borgpetersenii]ABJ76782.1 Permease of the major facilitator superfamily [Leptospira borgpetersenii serovar Hardjo-bovis str. JB197]ABJ78354.1 Permease of the major facilitator superfamily [Leptospira borgpetersenii serovar Hardjo-bovis str. L550]AMX57582.1 ABC transporter permease [Leptospira borgpetersenii serovar Hardjo]AMX60813.1 ABC transporter permease [Leptospira borgpetersenii serovar Hardjo]AMX64058.1 ABC transporter permease [Leptospira borgpetersenii se